MERPNKNMSGEPTASGAHAERSWALITGRISLPDAVGKILRKVIQEGAYVWTTVDDLI